MHSFDLDQNIPDCDEKGYICNRPTCYPSEDFEPVSDFQKNLVPKMRARFPKLSKMTYTISSQLLHENKVISIKVVTGNIAELFNNGGQMLTHTRFIQVGP